jgi:hypothetical protein
MRLLILAGALAALAGVPSWATSGGYSLGINFGADEPAASGESVLAANEVAGVPAVLQGNWNNVSGANGSEGSLVADNRGAAAATTTAVEWTSNGSWASQGSRGENNNNFAGADRKLMTGYLDTGDATTTRVTFTGLPTELTSSGFDVYVYTLGGVAGRGGTFRLESASGASLGDAKLVSAPTNPGTYVEDTGASHDAAGTYMVFTAVSGSSFTLVATTAENPLGAPPRAPINAVQLVARTGEVLPVVRAATGDACTFQINIDDLGAGIVNASTIAVKLDGQTITTQNTKNGGTTSISYDLLARENRFFASGSQHTVEVTFRDTRNNLVTAERTFTVAPYATIPASAAITNFDANSSGFSVRPHQIGSARGAGDVNSIANAEAQLAGRVVDAQGQPVANIADLSAATGGRIIVPVVNWEQNGFDIANNPDNFNSAEPESDPRPNEFVPGMSSESTDNFVAEITAALELKRGCYVFGVNSDDGFLATIGGRFGTQLGSFSGGRGAADTLFSVVVEQDGVYPLRLTWWEGGGGASVEFFTVNGMTGERILVNDRTKAGAVRAFATFRGPGTLASVGPTQSTQGVGRAPTVIATFQNDLTSVDNSSIRLFLDNAQVNATTTTSGSAVTTQFTVPTQYAFGSTHTGAVVYAIGGVTQTNIFTFTVRSEGAADLAGGLAIEIEHFDYDGGQMVAAVNTMPYTGEEYRELGAIHDVDYHQGGNDTTNDEYRFGEEPNVPMNSELAAGTLDVQRPGGWEVTTNYKIGWAGGDWYNFTRNFTNSNYKIYAAQSHGDAAGLPNRLVARYGVVTEGVGTTAQTVAEIGSYSAPSSGGWGNNDLVQVRQPNGQPTVIRLNGRQTIRVWVDSGDFDWFAFVPTTEPTSAPSVSSVSLANGAGSWGQDPLIFNLNDFLLETSINTNSIRLTVNGTDVTSGSTIERVSGGARVRYLPAAGFTAGVQNYTLTFLNSAGGGTTNTGSFNVLGGNLFVIEAEDFNHSGGQTIAAASTMPLASDLYNGLSAVSGVDYNVINDQQEADAQQYRQDESPNVPIPFSNGDLNRGSFQLTANYRIGWIDNGEWWNYTRNFPNGNYNVYVGLSHGGGGPTSGSLQLVTGDATQPNQTVQQLGTFDQAGGTAGWGVNRLVPLRNAAGQLASIPLAGPQTIRYTASSGDFDYLIFSPATAGPGPQPSVGISRTGNTITVTWTGGTLQSSPNITGPWAPVAGATGGTYTTTAEGTRRFFRASVP